MPSRHPGLATAILTLTLAACSAPSEDGAENASLTAQTSGAPSQNDQTQIPPPENEAAANEKFEGGSLDADDLMEASEPDVPCNERDVSLYTKLLRDAEAMARQQALNGSFDAMATVSLALPVFRQMSPRCVDLLNKLAQEQRRSLARDVPEWATKPMPDCTCHGSVCSPCEGVNY